MESLKTMRNSIGVLDGTLQLLKATRCSLPLHPSLSLFSVSCCFAFTLILLFVLLTGNDRAFCPASGLDHQVPSPHFTDA